MPSDLFDLIEMTPNEYEHEMSVRMEGLNNASVFLYPRLRVARELLMLYDSKEENGDNYPFLYKPDLEDAHVYIREQFQSKLKDQIREHNSGAVPPWNPKTQRLSEFGDYYIPYVISEPEIVDGVGLYYQIKEYLDANRKNINEYGFSGEMGIWTYTSQVLWNMRRMLYVERELEIVAQGWLFSYEAATLEQVLTLQIFSSAYDVVQYAGEYSEGQSEKVRWDMFDKLEKLKMLKNRDDMLRLPYLMYLGNVFASYTQNV